MKKIVFICPFFGKLPENQISIWLKTCEKNPKIEWIILTDDKQKYSYPKNVKVIYTTLNELKKTIQKKFDFKISLESAYKLCDFKPTYGYIFQDLIKEYDYWGHCDLSDSIFGDIEKNLSNILEQNYDKIGFLGHLTLYKNNEEVNKRFFLSSETKKPLNEILGIKENMGFDETYDYSINSIYKYNHFDLKRIDDLYVDISTRSSSFRNVCWSKELKWDHLSKEKYIIEWQNGNLYKVFLKDGKIKKEELLYVHYQKRKMNYKIDMKNINHFFIVPNEFIYIKNLNPSIIKKYTKEKLINKTLFYIRINKLKKKINNFMKG